jgi:hypothetical protein
VNRGIIVSRLAALSDLPPIYSPFPAAVHPRHEQINAHTAHWAEEFGVGNRELRRRFVHQDLGTFAARVLPEGREEVVAILGNFVWWLFAVDDGYCEEGEIGARPGELVAALSRLLRVAQNPEAPMLLGDPLAEGVRDLRRRIDRCGTVGQAARWIDTLREYFLSVVWEAHHRSRQTVPDLNDYTLMRLYDGATSVVYPLLEVGHGYELRPDERDSTPVRAAMEMASFVITWDNDLFSLHKETAEPRYVLNAVKVLMHTGQTLDEAVAAVVEQRNRVLALFLDLRQHLLAEASPHLRQYLHNLGTFIRGAQDWGVNSLRYAWPGEMDFTKAFRTTLTVSREPLEIPAVSWWWTELNTARLGRSTGP